MYYELWSYLKCCGGSKTGCKCVIAAINSHALTDLTIHSLVNVNKKKKKQSQHKLHKKHKLLCHKDLYIGDWRLLPLQKNFSSLTK